MEFRPLSKYYLKQNWLRLLISAIVSLSIVLFYNYIYLLFLPFLTSIFFISKSDDFAENLFHLYFVSQALLIIFSLLSWFFYPTYFILYLAAVSTGFLTSLIFPLIAMRIQKGIKLILLKLRITKEDKKDKYYERHDIIKSGNKELTG